MALTEVPAEDVYIVNQFVHVANNLMGVKTSVKSLVVADDDGRCMLYLVCKLYKLYVY